MFARFRQNFGGISPEFHQNLPNRKDRDHMRHEAGDTLSATGRQPLADSGQPAQYGLIS